MSTKVTQLALQKNDNRLWDAKAMLQYILDSGHAEPFPSGIVILLDLHNNNFVVRTAQAQLKDSEAIALLEVVKQSFVKNLL